MENILSWIPLDVTLIAQNFDRFLYGVWVTLNLTFLALFTGGLLAIPMAIARASRHRVLNPIVLAYTYVFRGTPLLVQTYLIYYGLGQFEAVRQSWLWAPVLSSAWWCAFIAFTLNTAAYSTELLRGAIADTPNGEVEAAIAIGHSYATRMRRVILPSAFRRAIPAYSNEVIFMLHGSVVASTITLQDILGVGRWLNGRYYLAYEGFITAALLYFLIVLCITRVFRWLEQHYLRHLARREIPAATEMSPDPGR
ncbi:ABC transporter permease [Mesorhizobium sp. GR13]|jgi:arginine/ornithine transport system permease protein|uniref:ABC transporter permease n=1 Tax=Mesorhizobium sp. GR13 TaxID=2562308 RepID=UPI0010C0EE6F|nr:ABC transporter permease [Mesorhizobium sp. GR13]